MDIHYCSEDDDSALENTEMVGLLALGGDDQDKNENESSTDSKDSSKKVTKNKKGGKGKKNNSNSSSDQCGRRICTRRTSNVLMKPLEILYQRKLLQQQSASSDDDGGDDLKSSSSSSRSAFHLGLLLLVLSFGVGIWYWKTHHDDEAVNATTTEDTNIVKWHKLKLKDIKQWCLDPEQEDCHCANPLNPSSRFGHKTWELAHDGNIRDAMNAFGIVDVVFLGDSIIEGWRGMSFGMPVESKRPNARVFDSLFSKRHGADFEGLALGIAGDKTNNLLWRIQNEEIPKRLHPSVWWIMIGTNDFLRKDYCSPEVVLMGIKRVVEEIRRLRPGSFIVVNSLLPRSDDEKGILVPKKQKSSLVGKKMKKSVWQGILEVNRGLRNYCKSFRNVVYFDATSIFLRQRPDTLGIDGQYIPKNLMADYLHPTAEGYKKWGDEIVSFLHQLVDASQSEMGRIPLPHWWKGKVVQKEPPLFVEEEADDEEHAGGNLSDKAPAT